MSGEQYSITAAADIDWGNALDLTSVSYDRGVDLFSDPTVILEILQTPLDKSFSLDAEAAFDLSLTPTKDIAVTAISDGFNQAGVFANPTVDLAFTDLNSEVNPISLSSTPSVDLAMTGEADGSFDISLSPTIDRTIGDGESEGQFYFGVERLLRSLFTAPPDAEITVLKYMSSESAETLLDGCTIEAGVTTILQLHILGSRLDTYLTEFFVRTNGDAVPVIYKSSSGSPGGIRIVGINNKATPSGTLQELIAQIILEPADTAQFEATSTVIYECRMSHRGFGEDYRIAPKKDRGETGLFTIAKY